MFNTIEQGKQEIDSKKQNLQRVQQLPKNTISSQPTPPIKIQEMPVSSGPSIVSEDIDRESENKTLDLQSVHPEGSVENSGPSYDEYLLLKAALRDEAGYSEETVTFLEGPQGGILAMLNCTDAVEHLKEAIKEVDPAILERIAKKRRQSVFSFALAN